MKLFQTEHTTQDHLEIEDIKDDLVVCKNGQVSLVLETTAVNFDLLDEREQEAKILAFAALINSLNFYVQIRVRTEQTDTTNYLEDLQRRTETIKAPGLKRQMEVYMTFIRNLTVNTDVLDKRFFVAVSSFAMAAKRTSMLKKLFGKEDKITNIDKILENAKGNLYPKRDHLIKQLFRMGVFARQLTTDELIRLFYNYYNPDTIGMQKLQIKYDEIRTPLITKE